MAAETKPLPTKSGDPMKDPPFVIITGKVGVGKSTSALLSFPNSYYVQTNDKNIRAYESYFRANPEIPRPAKGPTPYTLAKTRLDTVPTSPTFGQLVEVSVERQIRLLGQRWCRLAAEDRLPYSALVFDEWSTISSWIYEQMPASTEDDGRLRFGTGRKKGGAEAIDQFEVIAEFKRLHSWLCQLGRATRRAIVLVSHSADPKYQDNKDKPHYGKMLYPGGPAFPIGTLIRPVCAEADVVVEMAVEEGIDTVNRHFLTAPTERAERKFRDFRIAAREEIDRPDKLREMLLRAEFDV